MKLFSLPSLTSRFTCVIASALLSLQPFLSAQAQSYDFGSGTRNLTAPAAGVIREGSTVRHISAGDKITAAELAALNQVLSGGRQLVNVNTLGSAISGRVNIGSDIARSAASIVIPSGVSAFGNFGAIDSLNLTGNLTNSGALYAWTSATVANQVATINASNIYNNRGGVISSIVPVTTGVTSAISNLGLSLNATNDIVNAGTITSAGVLTFRTNSLTNAGLIGSQSGNVNIASHVGSNLAVYGTGGRVEAPNADINIGTITETAKISTSLYGGDWVSKNLNLRSGDGNVTAHIGEVTGVVNGKAGAIHLTADTSNLLIGDIATTGDPAFASSGSLTLANNAQVTTNGNPLALIAAGNINAGTATAIDTSSPTGGGDLFVVSGAQFVNNGTDIVISGGTTSGGNINLGSVSINTKATSGNGNGGSVKVVAFAGNVSTNDNVLLGNITTGGSGSGNNGNVDVIASAVSFRPITVGSIDTTGGSGSGGSIGIHNASIMQTGDVLINSTTGALEPLSSTFTAGASKAGSDGLVGALTAGSGDIDIQVGANFGLLTINSAGSTHIRSTGDASLGLINTNKLAVTAGRDIAINDKLTAPGGMALVASRHIYSGGGDPRILTRSATTDGGDVTMVAGADYTDNGSSISINGPSLTGGVIELRNSTQVQEFDTSSSALNGSGGTVNMAAYSTDIDTGYVAWIDGLTIKTGAAGTGSSGDVNMVAGRNAFSVFGGGIDTAGGAAGTGAINLMSTTPASGVTVSDAGALTGSFFGGAVQPNGEVRHLALTANNSPVTIATGNDTVTKGTVTGASTYKLTGTGTVNPGFVSANKILITAGTDINIFDQLNAPGGITLVAGRAIANVSSASQINTTNPTGDAGNIALIAGAQFTENSGDVTITGLNSTFGGGKIELWNGGGISSLDASSGAANGSGGNVTMIAMTNAAGTFDRGFVVWPANVTLRTNGNGAGSNGSVTIISDRQLDSAILIGNIDTTNGGGTPGSGAITLSNTEINFPFAISTVGSNFGMVSSGNPLGGAIASDGVIRVGTLTANNAPISLATGRLETAGTISGASTFTANAAFDLRLPQVNANNISLTASRDIYIYDQLNAPGSVVANAGGSISLISAASQINSGSVDLNATLDLLLPAISAERIIATAHRNLFLYDALTAPSGIVLVAEGTIITGSNTAAINTSNAAGDGGDVTMVAGAAFTRAANDITITGVGQSNGGRIELWNSGGLSMFDTTSSFAGGSGGNVTLAALTNDNSTGFITTPLGSTIRTNGLGTGSNGNVTLVSGRSAPSSIFIGGVDTTGASNEGLAGTGELYFSASQPITTPNVVINTNSSGSIGNITSGDFKGGPIVAAGEIHTGALKVKSADVIFRTGSGSMDFTSLSGARLLDITSLGSIGLQATSAQRVLVTANVDIALGGPIVAPGGILMVAGEHIYSANAGAQLNTSAMGDAGNLTLIAGALFSRNALTNEITISGPSQSFPFGSIDFNANGGLSALSTSSIGGNGSAGSINLISFGGVVYTNASLVMTGKGDNTGSNANLTIIAGANANPAISIKDADLAGGASGTGGIYISTSQPVTTTAVDISTASDGSFGAIANGDFKDGTISPDASQTSGTLTVDNANVTLRGGGNSVIYDAILGGNIVDINSLGSIGARQTTASQVLMTANFDIAVRQPIVAPGGILLVAGRSVYSEFGAGLLQPTLDASNTSGDGGNITVIAGADYTRDPLLNRVVINGASATGGDINFNIDSKLQALTTASTAVDGSGGNVKLVAYAGPSGGSVLLPDNGMVPNLAGGGAGRNGDLLIQSALNNGGQAIGFTTLDARGGGTGGGGNITLLAALPNSAVSLSTGANFAGYASGDFELATPTSGAIIGTTIFSGSGTTKLTTGRNVQINTVDLRTTGNAGTLELTTAGSLLTLGAASGNGIASIDGSGNVAGGDAGTVRATSVDNFGLTLAAMPLFNVTNGRGGTIDLNADAGTLTLPAAVIVDGGGTGPGGTIVLTGSVFANGGVNQLLSANGAGGGGGGSITVRALVGNITSGTGVGEFDATAGGTNGSISYRAAGNINVNGALAADHVSLQSDDAVTGNINVGNGASVTGSQSITLTVSGTGTVDETGSGIINGGTLTIVAGTSSTTLNTNVSGLNGVGGAGITVDNGTTNLALGTFGPTNTVNVTNSGAAGITTNNNFNVAGLSLTSGSGGINTSKQITSAGSLSLQSIGGDIQINDVITGGTSLSLDAGGVVSEGAGGGIVTPDLTVTTSGGAVTLLGANNNVGKLTGAGSAGSTIALDNGSHNISLNTFAPAGQQSVAVTTTGAIDLLSDLDVSALTLTGGAVTVGKNVAFSSSAAFTITGGGTMTTTGTLTGGAGSTLSLVAQGASSFSIQAAATADTVNLTVGTGLADQNSSGVITAPVMVNATANGGTIDMTAAINSTPQLNVVTTNNGVVKWNNGAAALNLGISNAAGQTGTVDSTGAGAVTLVALTGQDIAISSNGSVTNGGNYTVGGNLTISSDDFTNNNSLTAGKILIQNHPGDDMTVSGNGSYIGNAYAPGAPGDPEPPTVKFVATGSGADLTITGNQNYTGDTEWRSVNGDVTLTLGSMIAATNNLTVRSQNFNGNAGDITANDLIFDVGHTIVNTDGDVNLPNGTIITLHGQDFAILAKGNITAGTGVVINLSSAAVSAGTLTLIAGFDASPSSGGQFQTDLPFTITGPSTMGGDINMGTTTFNLSSSAGSGGNLVAVASGGDTNFGSVTLGSIDTSSSFVGGNGGNVTVIGVGGVNTSTLSVGGNGGSNGQVSLSVADPTITGTIVVTDGSLSGGSFSAGSTTNGNMVVGQIDGASSVSLLGAKGASDTITQVAATTINAPVLSLTGGTGNIDLTSTAISTLNSTSDGVVTLENEAGSLTLGTVGGAGQKLTIAAVGDISTPVAGFSIDSVDFSSDTITLGGNVGGSTSVTLNGMNSIAQSGGKVTGGALAIAFGNGSLSLDTSVASLTSNAPGNSLTISEDDGISVGSINLGSLIINAGQSGPGTLSTAADLTVGGSLTLKNNDGDVALNNNITGSGIDVTASGAVTQAASKTISGASLNVGFASGSPLTLGTNVGSLTTNASGQTLTINELDDIAVGAQSIGTLTVNSTLGNITTAPGTAVTVASGLTLNAFNNIGLGDDVTVTSGNLTLNGAFVVQTAGTVTADQLSITFTGAPVTLTTNVNSLISSGGGSLTVNERDGITLGAQALSSLIVNAGLLGAGTLAAGDLLLSNSVSLNNASGSIQLNGDVSATSVTYNAVGSLSQAAGKSTSATTLSVGYTSGSTTLSTSIGTLQTTGTSGLLTINESDAITLDSLNDTALTVNASQSASGDITTTGTSSVSGNLILNNPNGNIAISSPIGSTGGDVAITASGALSGSGRITGNNLSLSFGSTAGTLNTSVSSLSAVSTNALQNQSLDINNTFGSKAITLGMISNLRSLTLTNSDDISTTAGMPISVSDTLTFSASGTTNGITLNDSVSGLTAVNLTCLGSTIVENNGAVINGGALNVTAGSSVTLATNVTSISSDVNNQAIYNEANGVDLLAQSGNIFVVNAGQSGSGTITVQTAFSTTDSVTLNNNNGGIVVNQKIGPQNSITLLATSDITGSGLLDAPVVDIETSAGNIGTNNTTGRVNTTGTSLTVRALQGNAFIADSATSGPAVLADGRAKASGGTFDLASSQAISITDTSVVSGDNVVLNAQGGITIDGANIGGGTLVDLTATGDLQTTNNGIITATSVRLSGANIGSGLLAGNEFNVAATNLVANATLGFANISDANGFNFSGGTSSAVTTFQFTSSGSVGQAATGSLTAPILNSNLTTAGSTVDLTAATNTIGQLNSTVAVGADSTMKVLNGSSIQIGTITGSNQDLTVQTTGASTDINIPSNLTVHDLTLNAGGTIVQGASTKITANALSLAFGSGPVTLTTAVNSLTTNASGQTLTINEDDAISLGAQTIGDLTVNAGGNISTVGAVSTGGDLVLNATAGDVIFNGALTAGDDMTLSASGTITGSGKLIADGLSLTYGMASLTFATNVNSLATNAPTGNLTINEDDSIIINSQSIDGLTVNAAMAQPGFIQTGADLTIAGALTLRAFGGGINIDHNISASNITLNSVIGIFQDGIHIITTPGLLDLTWANTDISLKVNAGTVSASSDLHSLTLNSTGAIQLGSITGIQNLDVTANGVISTSSVSVIGVGGGVTLDNHSAAADIVLNNSISAGLLAPGNVTLWTQGTVTQTANSEILAFGSLILKNDGGHTVTVATSVEALTISSTNGIVTINEADGVQIDTSTLTAGSLIVNDYGGNVVVSGTLSAPTIALTNLASGTIKTSATGSIVATSFTVATDLGNVDAKGIFSDFSGASNADITVTQTTTNPLTVNDVSGANVTVQVPFSATPNLIVAALKTVQASGQVNLAASNMTNNGTVQGNVISIGQSLGTLNEGITIGGNGTFNATTVTNVSTLLHGGSITFDNAANVVFNGDANLLAVTGTTNNVVLNNNATVSGTSALTVYAANINLGINSVITGNPLVFISVSSTGAGNITSTGDLTLPTKLVFHGQNLSLVASGNIISPSALTTIDLSNAKGNGGSLTVLAGYDFTLAGNVLTVTGPSVTSGGSVYMANTAIKTSSSFVPTELGATTQGGSVTVIANGVAGGNAGTINLGTITTSASTKVGTGGSVTLIGTAGVQTKAITTSGATAGSVRISGSAPQIVGGSMTIVNGTLLPGPGVFTGSAPDTQNGAAVFVNGNITANGAVGRGGNITIDADEQIVVNGAISATGKSAPPLVAQAGGNVDLASLNASITTKNITTSAIASNQSTKGGNAGNITLLASSAITTGTLAAVGSTNAGTGGGGDGGGITITTAQKMINGTPYAIGTLAVTGFVSAKGGDGSTKGGNGGDGGDIVMNVANFKVSASSGGASILSAGGLKKATIGSFNNGTGGTIVIDTYNLQTLPTTLDLSLNTPSIAILPGATLEVGVGKYNGTAGTISGGNGATNTVIPLKTNVDITSPINGVSNNGIKITVHGGDMTFLQNGSQSLVPLFTAGKRTLISGAQAAELFQTSYDANQTTPVNHLTVTGAVATGGTLTINETVLNGLTLTKLAVPSNVTVAFTGARPAALIKSTVWNGTIDFPNAATLGYLNFSAVPTISTTGSLTANAAATVILSSAGLKNNGTVNVGDLIINRASTAAFALTEGANSDFSADQILLGTTNDVGLGFTVKGIGVGSFTSPINFGSTRLTAQYQTDALAIATNINKVPAITFSFGIADATGAAVPISIGGLVNATSASISGLTTTVKVAGVSVKVPTNMTIGADITTTKGITIKTTGTLDFADGVHLTAGLLKANPMLPTWVDGVPMTTAQIASAGPIVITVNGNLTVGDNNIWIANGSSITATSKSTTSSTSTTTGAIVIGDNNLFRAMGGNVNFLTLGGIGSGNDNQYQAKGIVGAANGGIEFAAGQTTSTLATAFGLKPLPFNNVGLAVNGSGNFVINQKVTAPGAVTFGTGVDALMNHGALNFDLKGQQINFGTQSADSTFATQSSKPIADTTAVDADYVVDTDDEIFSVSDVVVFR